MQQVPQNFTYTSRATEFGRGTKTKKLGNAPEWTPGPGEYILNTDFNKKTADRIARVENNEKSKSESPNEVVEVVPAWNQKGFR